MIYEILITLNVGMGSLMRWSRAFLLISVYSYLALLVFSGLRITILDLPMILSVGGSLLAALLIATTVKYPQVGTYFAVFFGCIAMLSFSGIIQWVSYYTSTIMTGSMMATWDIVIGVCMLMESDLTT